MREFDFKKTIKLSWFSLKTYRKQVIGWCVAIFAITFLYMILFPSVKDMAQIKLNAMPKELMQFVGMNEFSDMSDFVLYFGMIFNLVLVAVSVFAATFSANLLLKEEKSRSMEFLYALETSRIEIYLSKCIAALVSVFAVLAAGTVSAAICGYVNGGETFVVADFLKVIGIASAIAFIFSVLSLLIAGISAKIGAPMLGSMAVIFSYVLGFLSHLLGDQARWLSWFSPFDKLSAENILAMDSDALLFLAIYILFMIGCLLIGCRAYRKRDFCL